MISIASHVYQQTLEASIDYSRTTVATWIEKMGIDTQCSPLPLSIPRVLYLLHQVTYLLLREEIIAA